MAEAKQQGFVTVIHTLELLQLMSKLAPQFIAKHNNEVVGYVLTMDASIKNDIPVLQPMFKKVNQLTYNGQKLDEQNYITMGQVCIAKAYRGEGIFAKLYENMFVAMRSKYKFVVTEISVNNPRSVRAHEKIGFKELLNYKDEIDHWSLVIKAL